MPMMDVLMKKAECRRIWLVFSWEDKNVNRHTETNNIPFPGPDPPTISQTKLKNIIFCAMPITSQPTFFGGARYVNVISFATSTVHESRAGICWTTEHAWQF
jgi:hypothetical protein